MKDEYRLVRDCVAGHIYDSCPTDFTSDMGTRFLLKPTVLKVPHPPRLVSWIANGIASSLDALFLNRFESQRAEYWQTLYSSVVCIYQIYCYSKPTILFSALFISYHSFAVHGGPISHFMLRGWWPCSLSNYLQFCSAITRAWGWREAGEMEQLSSCRSAPKLKLSWFFATVHMINTANTTFMELTPAEHHIKSKGYIVKCYPATSFHKFDFIPEIYYTFEGQIKIKIKKLKNK